MELTQEQKFQLFVDDSKVKLDLQGPYVRLRLLVKAVQTMNPEERATIITLFGLNYDGPAAFTYFHEGPDITLEWLEKNWQAIRSLHKERRPTASPRKTFNAIQAVYDWLRGIIRKLQDLDQQYPDDNDLFDEVMAEVLKIPTFGRYISIRVALGLCESILGRGQGRSILPEGSFVRKSLALWYPEHEAELLKTGPHAEKLAEILAATQRERLREDRDLDLTPLAHTEFLCEFRQAMRGRFYSARPLDEQLRNGLRQQDFGTPMGLIWKTRADHIPHQYLGEMNNWQGPRHELHSWMRDHGTLAP